MGQLIRLYTQIALLRRGPQDVPVSAVLLVLTIAAYFLVNFAVSSVLPPFNGPWVEHLWVDVIFTFAWYLLLLKLLHRPERFLQTAAAVYGFQTVLSPLLVAVVWLTRRFEPDSLPQFIATLASLALIVWIITANSHIVKSALEWTMAPSVALVIIQTLAGNLLVLALFPLPVS